MPNHDETQFPMFRNSISKAFLAAREAVVAPIRPVLRDADLTEQQWRALRVLNDARDRKFDAQTLAAECLLHAASITRIIKELGNRGLVSVSVDAEDGRRRIVVLTDAGHDLVESTVARTMAAFNVHGRKYGFERMEQLRQDLLEFIRIIDE